MEPRAPLRAALEHLARAGDVTYAECRYVERETESIRARDGVLDQVESSLARGVGVRVLCAGAWGFASTPGISPADVLAAAQSARAVARASALAGGEPVALAAREPARGRYASAVERDPFAVPLEEKVALLVAATLALRRDGAPVRHAEGRMHWSREHKVLLTSDGVDVEQRFTWGGAGLGATAVGDDGTVQRRSFPAAFDGDTGQGGYERVARTDWLAAAERMREELRELLAAPAVPAGVRTVILGSSQLALQVHESCGHPTELDRALGTEISLAGGSFLQPGMRGSFMYGAPHIQLTADATSAGGLGTFGWDDEGTAATRTPLVERGCFVGYLSSRETAARLGVPSSGAMRAEGFGRIPLIRMVNVNLEPDPHGPSLEELIADTADGLYIETNRSWSIDDLRLNFQFGCEIAWEIKRGRRVRVLRNPLYTGVTPRFWQRCDAVCSPAEWRLWGVTNCGKGEPMQLMQVGHGAAPARFREVEVGGG